MDLFLTSIFDQIITQVTQHSDNVPIIQLKNQLEHNFTTIRQIPLNLDINPYAYYTQIKVHQQHIYNLCGYHATYNMLQFIHSLKSQTLSHNFVENSVQFWRYVYSLQLFLKQYRNTNNIELVEPWRDADIEHGDFERSYLNPFFTANPYFTQTLKSEQINDQFYHIQYDIVYFQFGRIVNSSQEIKKIIANIHNFQQFNTQQNKEVLVQTYLLGITYHWISLIAIKSQEKTQFYVMDSKNKDYFIWNDQQIMEYLEEENKKRIKQGLKGFKPYEMDVYQQGMKDVSTINSLIVLSLLGIEDFEEYVNNQQTKTYIQPLMDMLNLNEEGFLGFEIENTRNILDIIKLWSVEYKHTLFSILKHQLYIPQQSKQLIIKLFQILEECVKIVTEEECFGLHQVYNIIHGTIENFENLKQRSKPKQINLFFDNSSLYEVQSEIIELRKVYVFDFKTKYYYFVIRVQFLHNIVHAQGGGQPDDEAFVEVKGRWVKTHNLMNDRQSLEVYLDLPNDVGLFEELSDLRKQGQELKIQINPKLRDLHCRIHSGGHLIMMILLNIDRNIQIKRTHHFVEESWIEFESPIKRDPEMWNYTIQQEINRICSEEQENMITKTLSHEETLKELKRIPEFVLQQESIRLVKLCREDRGYPCYGTHVKNVGELAGLHISKITEIENNRIYYEL